MEQSEKKHERKKTGKGIKIAAITTAAVVAAAGVFTAVCTATLPKDTIVNGVRAEGIDMGGMTLGEAVDALGVQDVYKGAVFNVSSNGKTKQIKAEDIDLALDVNATAQKAFDVCKTNNKIADAFESLKLKFTPEDISLVPSINEEKLNNVLFEFGKEVNGELKECTVEINGDKAIIYPGEEGQSDDVSDAANKVKEEIAKGNKDIKIDLKTQKPAEFDENTVIEQVHREPKNAEYALENGAAVVKPHVVGVEANAAEAKAAAEKVNKGEKAEISISYHNPEITEDNLKAKLYTGELASYSTKYNPSKENRSKNVELAASRINGTVLLPGDVFSYNGVVGERTLANGFKNAPVYENGKSVDGVGGGVCQVSTTLYSAVLYADLEIVQRQNHSLTVSYVPLGQDATVVDGAIDFRFKNNTDYPVKIVSSASKGTIYISLIGTPVAGKTVKISHQTVSTKEPTEKVTNDPNLPNGARKVTSAGKKGYTIKSTKTIYQNGNEVSKVSLGNSTYKMVPTEVSVGTGAAAAAPAQAAAPAAASPKTESTEQTSQEAKPISKPETKPETKTETKAESKPETKPESKPASGEAKEPISIDE